jgi:hypothetical protein
MTNNGGVMSNGAGWAALDVGRGAMTATYALRAVMFPVAAEDVRAGWLVTSEPVQRVQSALYAARALTEDAWNEGATREAIAHARRVLRLEAKLARVRAAYPDVMAHGPLQKRGRVRVGRHWTWDVVP